ncbi:hypothetical protein [Nonomuraea harbinensis]|uniref:Uncharacterized protein n=1 Tax=Nonomuraea harbinensis TaxID=1286938 RepID=A0ABW1BU80_9ACTN|nr:hypothetical protein [Nonomuraea harbinensis]
MNGPGGASPAGRLARELADHLARRGVESRVSECEGIALVGLAVVGLNVWCEFGGAEWRFRWSLDAPTEPGRWRYTCCPASCMETAARRIAGLFQERREAMSGPVTARAGRAAR